MLKNTMKKSELRKIIRELIAEQMGARSRGSMNTTLGAGPRPYAQNKKQNPPMRGSQNTQQAWQSISPIKKREFQN